MCHAFTNIVIKYIQDYYIYYTNYYFNQITDIIIHIYLNNY